ncbi:MAG: Hpt domain-containing protein [Macromonas sp.]
MTMLLDTSALQTLQELLGDDLLDITQIYADQVCLDVQGIQACWTNTDTVELGKLAHALKGGSSNMGAVEVARLAALLEKAALGNDHTTIGSVLKDLPAAAEQTVQALRTGGYLRA